jgi:hypothetical protein
MLFPQNKLVQNSEFVLDLSKLRTLSGKQTAKNPPEYLIQTAIQPPNKSRQSSKFGLFVDLKLNTV